MSKLGKYADLPVPEEWQEGLEGLRPAPFQPPTRPIPSFGNLVDACLRAIPDERDRALIWHRFGEGRTLQESGDLHGITRERVRQVVRKRSRLLLKNGQLWLIADHVFMGLGREGALVVDLTGASSAEHPAASPEELWGFMLDLWREVQGRPVQSVTLGEHLFLFLPEPLPSEQTLARQMAERASFIYPHTLATMLGLPVPEAEVVACGMPKIVRTSGGLYGLASWTLPQVVKATAEQLARSGFTEWHYSQIGKAAAYFDSDLAGTSSRNFAAVLSRPDVRETHYFEQAGRDGVWRLASLGDGYSSNLAAIKAIFEEAHMPLHWTDVRARLRRTVNDGTIVALLSREEEFESLGGGTFQLKGFVATDEAGAEDEFMRGLFASAGREWVPAQLAEGIAQQRGLDPERLRLRGRASEQFRYWKWGTGEALYVTAEEANRRFFTRWLAQRHERSLPEPAVALAGLKAAFQNRDRETLLQAYEAYQAKAEPWPPEASHWLDWALG